MNSDIPVIVTALAAVVALVASGTALYVSMSVRGALADFHVVLMKDLDERYVRINSHDREMAMITKEENHYRQGVKDRMMDTGHSK